MTLPPWLKAHAPFILEQFDAGSSMEEIANNLQKKGVENGNRYDRVYDVRKALREHDRIPQAVKRGKKNGSTLTPLEPPSTAPERWAYCPHCGKPLA
jgi:hypothetical protein